MKSFNHCAKEQTESLLGAVSLYKMVVCISREIRHQKNQESIQSVAPIHQLEQ